LRLCQLTQGGDEADAETGKESAGHEQRDGRRGGLEDDAKGEDAGGCDQAPPASEDITHRCRAEGTEEGPGRKDGDDRGLLGRSDVGEVVFRVGVTGGE